MIRFYLILLGVLFFQSMVISQSLVPFEKNGKYGFKDKNKEVITPKYDYACFFTNGLALVKSEGSWGFIDSTGNWKISPQFDNAQPFVNDISYVVKNGKAGLIKTNGQFLIKPLYSSLKTANNGFYTYSDNKTGFIYSNNSNEIPAKYIDLKEADGFISAKNNNNTWDIYYLGKLISQESYTPVNYNSLYQPSRTAIVPKNSKFGIYHYDKGWVIDPIYQQINTSVFYHYEIDGKECDFIYALYKYKQENEEESELNSILDGDYFKSDTIRFAKLNGNLISEEYFDNYIETFTYEENNSTTSRFQVIKNDKIFYINPDFSITRTDYNSITKFLDWNIATKSNGKSYLLNDHLIVIDSFSCIHPYMEVSDAYGNDGYIYPIETEISEPFLIIKQPVEQTDENHYALYSLTEQKRISPWIKSYPYVQRVYNYFFKDILYIYTDTTTYMSGFYVKGLKEGTPLEYSYIDDLYYSPLIRVQKKDDPYYELYEIKQVPVLKLREKTIAPSSQIKDQDILKSLINNEDLAPDGLFKRFLYDFLYTQNSDKKYGLICINGTIIHAQYDSISQNSGVDEVINVYKNNLIGYINIYNGDQTPVFSKTELPFAYDPVLDILYTKTGEDSTDYFITIKGKKFYQFSADDFFTKKKGLYGISSFSAFPPYEITVEKVPPIYKSIEFTDITGKYLVQNKKKLFGIINSLGDTLIPIKYTKVEDSDLEAIEGDRLYTVYDGKNKGLISLRQGEIVPPLYEKIDYLYDHGFRIEGYLVYSYGKKGFYHPSGKLIAPCDFEVIECVNHNNDYFKTMIGRKNGKWYSWNYDQMEQSSFSPINYKIAYDFIIDHYGYIKKNNTFLMYDLMTQTLLKNDLKEPISYTIENYSVFCLDGKCGVKNKEGKIIIEALYDKIQFVAEDTNIVKVDQNGILYIIDLTTTIKNLDKIDV